MPNDQKVVAMPTGEKIGFPSTMQDSEINNVLSNWVPGSGMNTPPTAPVPKPDMQTMATPRSVASSFGQGLLDVPRGIPHALDTWMEPEKNIGEPQQQYWQQTKQQFGQGNPTWIANAINAILAPTGLPQQSQAFAQGAMQDPVRAAGQGAGMYALGKVPEVPEMARVGAQKTLGVGPEFVRQGAEKVGEENAELVGKHQQRVETIQKANTESQQGFSQRQQHLQVADQHAQALADSLQPLHDAARDEARKAYGPNPAGKFDPTELKTAIEDTAKSKLQGNTQLPAAVSKIIKDIDKPPEPTLLDQASVFRGAGISGRKVPPPNAADMLNVMEPRARAKYLESLSPEERAQVEAPPANAEGKAATDASRLHGFMSELGRAGRSSSLAPDEASAINATRAMIEGRLRKMYESENRLGDFQAGQAKWKQMANTFENSASPAKGGSPIAQALQTKDPVTGKLRTDYVQAALSGDKSYPVAQEMLNRYKHLGAPVNELEVMKTHGDFADTLPSQVKWKQTPGEPQLSEFDPIEARKVALKQKGQSLAGTGGPYGVMRDVMGMKGLLMGNPMALSYPILRRMLGGGVGSEGLVDWLSKATPEELEMAKEIPAKKVALKKAEGK